ncbi:MAG: DUF6089 family protein [Bacteroidota bacterium]|nr:DUF6089 family protein [Bacteroidota bacterium]
MKKVYLVLFSLFVFLGLAKAQSNIDLGVFAGTSHYLGDLNKERLFYSPSFSFGGFYRYNLNPRYAIKAAVNYIPIQGNDADFANDFQQKRKNQFKTNITDISAQFEFNFLKFMHSPKKKTFSPYVSGGIGIALVNQAGDFSYNFVIPFGLGAKFHLTRRISVAGLWEFRKTFTDTLDGYDFPQNSEFGSTLHNNDWYYIAGITFCYKINYYKLLCPAYDD